MPPTTSKPRLDPSVAGEIRYTGHVTYLYAFDIAYEMARAPIPTLLGQPVAQFQMDSNKRAPRQLFFYRPQMVRLPPLERVGPNGPVRIERQVKIFPIGGISISVRVPFDLPSIADLVNYHDLRLSSGKTIHDEVLVTAEEVRRELAPYLTRPVEKLADDEAYTVFCITSPLISPQPPSAVAGGDPDIPPPSPHMAAEDWLDAHRREVAALLTEERDTSHLSDQEADESTSRYLSYYDHDLVVVDWDAALIIDEPRYIDEMIYLMELANLQLAELEAYDRHLDSVVDRAYRDLGSNTAMRGLRRWTGRKTLEDLREIRIDLARLSDELSNITKFFGDWHLARIYQGLAARFHLADWHKAIDEKFKTLDDLYQLLQADRNHRTMLILEMTIVLLFIIDVVMLFKGGMH
jgi:hypothetical protein